MARMASQRKLRTKSVAPTKEKRITRGGLKIRKLLKRRNLTTTAFARSAGVERLSVLRVTNGEHWRHISVDFALAVREVTRDTRDPISVEDFASKTAVVMDGEDEEPELRRRTGTDG